MYEYDASSGLALAITMEPPAYRGHEVVYVARERWMMVGPLPEALPDRELEATLELPTEARLEFMPNGGLLRLRLIEEYHVFLAERRCDLIAALLQPPDGFERDAFIPDEHLIPRVWGFHNATRTHLNTLIHRTRKTFARAGLDGAKLLERAPGGGGTRFQLDRMATIRVA